MHTTLGPVLALALWSLIMLGWMVARRFPAMKAKGVKLAGMRGGRGQDLERVTDDPSIHWPAHNYTHLMEQPTLFYAVALALFVMGAGSGWSAWLAWAYVGVRVAHSIVQSTSNIVSVRFAFFAASTLVLIVMIARAFTTLLR